jgi:hypothetical protein
MQSIVVRIVLNHRAKSAPAQTGRTFQRHPFVRGASADFNPEMDQGYGLQNTVGCRLLPLTLPTTRVGLAALPYMRAQRGCF